MADSKQSTTDCIFASQAAEPDAERPTELPPASDEHPIRPPNVTGETKVRSTSRIFAILAALFLVVFIAALDQTIVATAIPTISASLQSAAGYTWIGSAYLLANAATGPIWARCSDIWGRKPALLAAVVTFAIASMLAALSTNMQMLIAARALQGTAGGGLGQLVYITISDLFSMRRRALYFGLLGLMWAVAGSTGPLIGGALTELVSWRWCFWINLPVCAGAFVLLVCFLDVHEPRTKITDGVMAVDWLGTISIVAVTLLLLLGMEFGGATFPWDSPKVICLIVFGTLMIGFFFVSETRLAKYPLMHMGLFRNWHTNTVFIVAFAHSMVSFGIEYYLPLYFQSVKQASPLRSGILILPMMITEAAVDILVGILLHRIGRYREITWVGVTLMTLGTGLYINLRTDAPVGEIFAFEIIGGIGTALLFQTPIIAIQNTVTQADTASATATLGFIRNLATSFSIVLGGVIFQNGMSARQSSLADVGISKEILKALSGDKAAANVGIIQSISDAAQRRAVQDAFAWSLRNMFIFYTGIAGVALAAGIFIKHRHMSNQHTETKTGIEQLTNAGVEK